MFFVKRAFYVPPPGFKRVLDFTESFTAAGSWTLDAGLTIDGTLNQTGAAGTARVADYSLPVVSGRSYSVTFTLSGRTGGAARVALAGAQGTLRSADGTYVETLVPSAGDILRVTFTAAANLGIAVDNLIVREA